MKKFIYPASILLSIFLVCIIRGIFTSTSLSNTLTIFCDAFFIIGVLITGVSVISWASKHGAFDIFSYAGKVIIMKFQPSKETPTYAEYISEKKAKPKTWLKTLFIYGLICIGISLLLLLIYISNFSL